MIFSIPILVKEEPGQDEQPGMFEVRPLFHDEPVQRSEKLGRALNKLAADLHQALLQLGREPRHDELAEWTFFPELEEATLDLRLELHSGYFTRRFLFVGYRALARKLYFTPTLPELHFELHPGQALAERAVTVLTRHFREMEKDSGLFDLDEFALRGKARLTSLDISLQPAALAKRAAQPERALLFGGPEKKDGAEELRKVGRPMNQLYPDDLDRALGREREVDELARLLAAPDRRPILLVGPRQVGKTTVLHELVWRINARKKERYAGGRHLWALSPLRLISGMSFLGEWENRVLAILEHASGLDRVLCFEDLLGLFTAGISSASELNVAQVLRPALEKRTVRVIAELTPEAWRVLRERDRAFAELFHVIPIAEPPEAEVWRILIALTRQLEERYRCEFQLEVLPTVYELHRRFAGDAAFPGKAAGFLRRLAVRATDEAVTRVCALRAFHEQTGLQRFFLDGGMTLARALVQEHLQQHLTGQPSVLEAFADRLVLFKARLNDPRRPLGTLLLLGPTGVGKTQSAKALAQFLFGGADKMLRFDMNEYVDASAATRLIGTPREPEGLLTGAIRRQPFSVVLFDEIEKAAPEVFDMLLAVLDEGRLTDSLGRVADFTGAIILLTSNLGVPEARSRLGFDSRSSRPEVEDALYTTSAEKFFRPEFFNRLDRVIPFRALEPDHLRAIAERLLAELFARDGMRRRECLLDVTPAAMSRLVELGYHPQLGARALKRVIEREVAQPLATQLSVLSPGAAMLAYLDCQSGQFVVRLHELKPLPPAVSWPQRLAAGEPGQGHLSGGLLRQVDSVLERVESALEAAAPQGIIALHAVSPEQARYFACREQLAKVEHLLHAAQPPARPVRGAAGRLPKAGPKPVIRQYLSGNPKGEHLRQAEALRVDLRDWEQSQSVEIAHSPAVRLLRELALLEAMTAPPAHDDSLVLILRALVAPDAYAVFDLARCYLNFFQHLWGATVSWALEQPSFDSYAKSGGPVPRLALFVQGCNVRRLLPLGHHTILVRRLSGSLGLIDLVWREAASLADATAQAAAWGTGAPSGTGGVIGPVLQLLTDNKSLTDFRSGTSVSAQPSEEEFRALLLSALPLPAELTD